MRLIVSVVGTSILTNKNRSAELIGLLRDTANKTESECSDVEKKSIVTRKEELTELLESEPESFWREQSAEINGILSYDRIDSSDTHILLPTDTFQGSITAGLVEQFIRKQGCVNVSQHVPVGLSVKNAGAFQQGMVDIVKWCEETMVGYKDAGYEIIFNLTGGFKSVIGYMNTLGMIYADKLVYVFEAQHEIISIPRLPLKMDDSLAGENAVSFAMMNELGQVKSKLVSISDIPELYLDGTDIDNEEYVALSAWGTLVWLRCKSNVLGKGELQDWPLLKPEKTFVDDYKKIHDEQLRVQIQESLAKAAGLLLDSNGDLGRLKRDPGLLYEVYVHNRLGVGHFRINSGHRVSCKWDEETSKLSLRHVGNHDYVNDNP